MLFPFPSQELNSGGKEQGYKEMGWQRALTDAAHTAPSDELEKGFPLWEDEPVCS